MSKVTLGYSDSEDRIWILFRDSGVQLWMTRRLTALMLAHMLHMMAEKCPGGAAGESLPAATRLQLEHETALEVAQEEAGREAETGAAPETQVPNVVTHLVNSIDLRVTPASVTIEWKAGGFAAPIELNRVDAHKLMRALARRARYSAWDLPVPDWLVAD